MKDYLHSLGVKVPIVTSNLVAGAADVYGHTDGDFMENNSYFNHPLLPIQEANTYLVAGPAEYVSTNPADRSWFYGNNTFKSCFRCHCKRKAFHAQ